MKLILCRHGQTLWNTQHRTQGRTDIPLDERGLLQAAALGNRLRNLPIAAVYASPLSRACDTAAAAGFPIVRDERLLEREFGEWEGKRFSQLREEYPVIWEQWKKDPYGALPPGAESMQDLYARSVDFLEDMRVRYKQDELVLAVSHSVPVRLMVAWALGLPLENLHRFVVDNASYSELTLTEKATTLSVLNDRSHLLEIGVESL